MTQPGDPLMVPTAGPAIAVREHPGGPPPILALHGLASNARWWDLVAGRLEPARRLVALDLRGHGLSGKPETGYGFDPVVADLVAVVRHLRLAPLVVAGHSWGASVALSLAATVPESVLGVVCVDGGAADLRAFFGPDWTVAERAMRPPQLRGVTASTVRAWVEASTLAEGSDPATATAILLGNFEPDGDGTLRPRLSLERHMEIARALYELDGDALLRQVRCPVLLVPAGRPDDGEPRKTEAVERARSVLGEGVSVRWIDGSHDLPVQRPAEVAAAISEFVDGLVRVSG